MTLTQIFAKVLNMSLTAFTAKTDKNMMANMTLQFDVHDTAQLEHIIKQLKRIRGVVDVYRLKA